MLTENCKTIQQIAVAATMMMMDENYQRKILNATVIFVQLDNKKTLFEPGRLVFSFKNDIDWVQHILWRERVISF